MKRILPRFKTAKKLNGLGAVRKENFGALVPRLLLMLFIIVALTGMYVTSTVKRAGIIQYSLPDLHEGDISPRREIALIDFQVPKPPGQLDEERRQAASNVIPVFSIERDFTNTLRAEVDSLFSAAELLGRKNLPDSVRQSIEDNLGGLFTLGEVDTFRKRLSYRSKDYSDSIRNAMRAGLEGVHGNLIVSRKDDLGYYSRDLIMLEEYDAQKTVEIDTIFDVAEAADSLKSYLKENIGNLIPSSYLKTVQNAAVKYIRPNLSFNARRTGELRRQAMDAVQVTSASYKKNERIIEANVPVSESQIAALNAYRRELKSQTLEENRRKHYAVAFGNSIISFCIIGIFGGYLYLNRRKIFKSFSRLVLLTLISSLPLSVAYYTAWGGEISSFLVPIAVATILATILFDAEIGIMMSLGVSLLVATLIPGNSLRLGILYFLGGSVGVLTVGRVRHRKEFYRSMLFVPLTMALAVAATNDWIANPSIGDTGTNMFLAAINGFFCPIIAIGLLPLLESVFKIATDITLLELSDLNNPLLKEVAVKAPGTFSSVLMVGALAEAAAERIGANPLLARVGSYYHDIGKSVIPEYFIENQYGGENPHDRLSPHMSALVIASHVKEGYELGMKYGLPEAILDIIHQHHGTSLMASIYHKAEEKAGGDAVEESAFRYPGPKPQTREAGIVMLADLVEAASRTIQERTPGRLKTLIRTIIQKRFLEGELDECDLTLRDLHNIQEAFLPVLVGSYHRRIEYPWQKEAREKREDHAEKGKDADNNEEVKVTDSE